MEESSTHPEGAGMSGPGRWLVWLLLALGVGLRAMQFFGFVDMWHDELAIARNVEERSLVQLVTEPLDYKQVAPVGFLAWIKVGTSLFGTSNAGFRAMPFFFSLAGLFLFWRVLRRFALGWGLVAALGLVAVSPALFWYGNAVKPYGMDVTISLLLVWLALRHLERPEDLRRGVLAGLVGVVAIPTSFPAAPIGALLGLVLVYAWSRREAPEHAGPLAALGSGWTLGAVTSTWSALSLLDPGTDDFMQQFWVEGFPPDGLLAAVAWAGRTLFLNFAHSLYFLPPINAVFVFVAALPLALACLGLLDYLDTIGREVERIPGDRALEPTGASAEGGAVLFDLSDPVRLEAASAETFEIPEHLRGLERGATGPAS